MRVISLVVVYHQNYAPLFNIFMNFLLESFMKKIVLGSIILNIVFVAYVSYVQFFTHVSPSTVTSDHQYRIAILTPVTHPALEEIENGFKEQLVSAKVPCIFTTYNANGNQALMRSQVEEILQEKYDLIFTVATHATKLMKEVSIKKQITTPIVFGAVCEPVQLDLIKDKQSSGNHLTGTTEEDDYQKQIALLFQIKPSIKNLLLVYDPKQGAGKEQAKLTVEKLLQERGVTVTIVEVFTSNEIQQKVHPLMQGLEVVMIFKDNTVVPAVDGLIKLCERYGVTLFTTDLASVDKGAVLGYGVYESSFGTEAAKLATQILVDKKTPSQLPIVVVSDFHLRVNTKAMEKQGLVLDQGFLALLKAIEIK